MRRGRGRPPPRTDHADSLSHSSSRSLSHTPSLSLSLALSLFLALSLSHTHTLIRGQSTPAASPKETGKVDGFRHNGNTPKAAAVTTESQRFLVKRQHTKSSQVLRQGEHITSKHVLTQWRHTENSRLLVQWQHKQKAAALQYMRLQPALVNDRIDPQQPKRPTQRHRTENAKLVIPLSSE